MERNEKDSRNVKKEKKNLPHTPSLPEKNPETEGDEKRDETGQGRIPEIAGADDKMGAHTLSRVPNFSVWLFTWREAGSLTG